MPIPDTPAVNIQTLLEITNNDMDLKWLTLEVECKRLKASIREYAPSL